MIFDQQYRLKWNNHKNTVLNEFEILLRNDRLVDCTIGADGKYLKAHKLVLSACSPYFEELLSEHYDKHPIILLKDVSFNELKHMIDYMYRGEVNITDTDLLPFLKTAHSLKIKGLTEDGEEDALKYGCKPMDDEDDEDDDDTFVDSPPDSQNSDEPPIKKPVPASMLLNCVTNVINEKTHSNNNRKPPPDLQQVFSGGGNACGSSSSNSCSSSSGSNNNNNNGQNVNNVINNNNSNKAMIMMNNECSEFESRSKDQLESNNCDGYERSTISSPYNSFQSKSSDVFIKKEPLMNSKNNGDNYICVDVDVDLNTTSSYNDDVDSTSVNSSGLADQIIAGKNLTELTITSIADDSSTILKDEDWNPYISLLNNSRVVEAIRNSSGAMEASLKAQRYSELLNQNNEFVCLDCGKSYNRKGNLGRHKRYECGKDKQFKCPACPKSFFRKDKLSFHKRMSHHMW